MQHPPFSFSKDITLHGITVHVPHIHHIVPALAHILYTYVLTVYVTSATLSPWTLPSPNTSSTSSKPSDNSPPGPKPVPRPRTGSLKTNQHSPQKPSQRPQQVQVPTTQPSIVFGPRNASEPAIRPLMSEVPPLPGKKRRTTSGPEIIVESQSQGSLSSITESTETITNSLSSSVITPTNSNSQQNPPPVVSDDSTNKPPPSGSYHVPIEVGDKENKSGDTSPKLAITDTTVTSVPILAPPMPAPRRGASRKRSANAPTSDLAPGPVSPLATNQMSSTRSGSASPIIFGNGSVSNGTGLQVPDQNPSQRAVPLAIAFQETCNAIFKGTDVTKCQIKVDGEMVMSFPADFIPKVSSHDVLSFRLEHMEDVVGLRHNQRLVKK